MSSNVRIGIITVLFVIILFGSFIALAVWAGAMSQ